MGISIERNQVVSRRNVMGLVGVGTVVVALAAMWVIDKDVRGKEGKATLYEHRGHGIGGTDKAMTSHDVNATVSIPKPGKERVLGSSPDTFPK